MIKINQAIKKFAKEVVYGMEDTFTTLGITTLNTSGVIEMTIKNIYNEL